MHSPGRILHAGAIIPFALAMTAGTAPGQILMDRDPVRLEYVIRAGESTVDSVGTFAVSFEPTDTPSGRRLLVHAVTQFGIELLGAQEHHSKIDLVCDKTGLESFAVSASSGERTVEHTANRKEETIVVRSLVDGKKASATIPSSVLRTDLGLYCGAFLAESLADGPMMRDFPLLVPASGGHAPRQKFREGILRILHRGQPVRTMVSRIVQSEGPPDRYWHTLDEWQLCLRRETVIGGTPFVFELAKVNGEPYRVESDSR
ncbi:MAG: hypothetical protein QF819_07595 [Gemmatimonadota bacterium]|jgi:hypothetical protein|nr:hypothetical protein [Gemmatimonadota bacterium]MDP6460778.1 hypothetical protein [Gemmatimonadota bacterium]MDP6528469.1 hypothetical protein [Gemmatimonadota bacterium]MDP6803022.1 hypothetical protein [Gemmatimonadota bacterium]MDP7032285.1 hypothetical protein [Gemmatimonadota bacterium]